MKKSFLKTVMIGMVIGIALSFAACKTDNDLPENPFTEDKTNTTLDNGGFEKGLENWLVLEGEAFNAYSVIDSKTVFWECIPFMAKGSKLLNGYENGEDKTGSIRSQMFTLGGDGYISFMVGGTGLEGIYITVHKEDGTEIKRYTNTGAFSDPGMTQVLHREYMDLSANKGQVLYIKITDDAASGGFAAMTADDFIVSMTEAEIRAMQQSTYDEIMALSDAPYVKPSGTESFAVNTALKAFYTAYAYLFPFIENNTPPEDETKTTLEDGGFESGGLDYWVVVEGNAFTPLCIINTSETFWGEPSREFMAKGSKFFNGFNAAESLTGKLRSRKFTLAGDGFISFMIGGGAAQKVTVHKAADNSVIASYTNTAFKDPEMALNLHREWMDLSAYKNQVLYIQLEDPATSDFGSMTADDFIVSMTLAQARTLKQQTLTEINALVNGPSTSGIDVNAYIKQFYADYVYPFTDN